MDLSEGTFEPLRRGKDYGKIKLKTEVVPVAYEEILA